MRRYGKWCQVTVVKATVWGWYYVCYLFFFICVFVCVIFCSIYKTTYRSTNVVISAIRLLQNLVVLSFIRNKRLT